MPYANIRQPDQKDLRQCWRTDPWIFMGLNRQLRFSVDACADRANALLPKFWDEEADGFSKSWRRERVFCNPPFARCRDACRKAGEAKLAAVIVPNTSLNTRYVNDHPPAFVVIPPRSMPFLPPPGLKSKGSGPIPCNVLLYGVNERTARQLEWLGRVVRWS